MDPEKKEKEQTRLDEKEPKEAENSAETEEDDWLDEPEPEEAEDPAETEEDDWLDEPEPEEAEDSAETEEDDWLDEEEPEEAEDSAETEEDDWLDEPEPEDAEEDTLANIVAVGMREGPEDAPRSAEESEGVAPPAQESENPEEAEEEEWLDEEESEEAEGPEETEGSEETEEEEWLDEEELEGLEEEAEGEEAPGEEKPRRRRWVALIIVVAALVAAYLFYGYYFRSHFEPNTVINGIDCSYMTEPELEDAIQDQIDEYELQIVERTGDVEALDGKDFGLHVENGNTLTDILEAQGAFTWPKAYFKETTYNPTRTMAWDEEEFTAAIDRLNCMDESQMIDPKDAEIVYDEDEEKYVVEPAVYGTHIKPAVFTEVVTKAIASLADYVDLEDSGCYETPNVTEESPEMIAACEQMNQMITADITYDMIDVENIHITKDQIKDWISVGSDLVPTYNEEAIREFIAGIADQYNTVGRPHTLHTSWDTTVTVDNGTYGWELDQDGEYEQLIADLSAGESVTREPVWAHSAVSHNDPDYGNTYVEANLTRQHLYFYKGGTLITDTDFVSGRMTTSRVTHEGVYYVYYKQSPAVLKGADYESPVTYWMPFNGGEGLHDATWRGSFGGTIYQYGGSHGCINLPYSAAEIIYNNISVGDCVFVYWEDGMTMQLVRD